MENKYPVTIYWSAESHVYVALFPDFPEVTALGETRADAASKAFAALSAKVASLRDSGETPPEPTTLPRHSGQLRIRIPKQLHTRLVLEAERQGVSLNMLIVDFLEQGRARAEMVRAMRDEVKKVADALLGVRAEIRTLKDQKWESNDAFSAGAPFSPTFAYNAMAVQTSYASAKQPVPQVFLRR
jgi:predicted RNase H-like HicB family nuclease